MEKTMNQTTSQASEELKPCPFCGGNFKIAQEPHDNGYVSGLWYVYHDYGPLGSKARSCPFSFERHFNSKQDAINACNTRTSPQAESVGDREWTGDPHGFVTFHSAPPQSATNGERQAALDYGQIDRLIDIHLGKEDVHELDRGNIQYFAQKVLEEAAALTAKPENEVSND